MNNTGHEEHCDFLAFATGNPTCTCATSNSAMAHPETVQDVLAEMRRTAEFISTLDGGLHEDRVIDYADRIERALSARASAGEGGVTDEMVERGTRIAYGDQPRDACGMRMRKDIRKILEGALHPQEYGCNCHKAYGFDTAEAMEESETTPPAHGDGEAQAWMHEGDASRVISARQKAQAIKDGGASASSVAPYTIALTTRPTPEAQEARDAARYRYIRGANGADDKGFFVCHGTLYGSRIPAAAELDAAIDAALALPAQGEGK